METLFKIESPELFSRVSEELLDNLYNPNPVFSTEVDAIILQSGKEELKQILLKNNYDMTHVKKIFNEKNWCQERVKNFITLLEKRKAELLYATCLHYNMSYGETITDFDWVVKLVCGTSDLKTLSYPLLQLILSSANNKGVNKQVYDVNKITLAKIIELLEKMD